MNAAQIATYVVTGATGSGKTALIERLIAARPARERWAVLVNDFGRAALAAAPGIDAGEVVVREVAGCICCTARVGLRTALVALVRDAGPQRVFIEASAAAEPEAILSVLREPGIARALALRSVVAVADAAQLGDARYSANAVYRAQLGAGDIIALRGVAPDEHPAARRALVDLIGADKAIADLDQVDLRRLDALAP